MHDPRIVALFGYVGPGPGLELIPYFLSLLTWVGLAFGAVLAWPIAALLRRGRGKETAATADEAPSPNVR